MLEPDTPQRLLRILFVVEATLGGTARHVLDLTHALLARGHEVHIVYSPVRMERRFASELAGLAGIHAFALPMRPEVGLSDCAAVCTIRKYIRKKGPFDVVHGHSSKGGAIARLAAAGLRIPKTVYTAHAFYTQDPALGLPRRLLYGAIEAFLGRFFTDNVIATSAEELAHGLAIGIPHRRLTVIHNAARRPPDVPNRVLARQMFTIAENDTLLVYVGRLSQQKAPGRFIDLIAALRHDIPRLRALMLGYGEMEADVRRQIDSAGVGDIVSLHTDGRGWDAIAAADLFVLTSRYEGMPYTLLEAASLGVPILATPVGGVAAVTAIGAEIRVVPQMDGIKGFAQAASELLVAGTRPTRFRRCPSNVNAMADNTLSLYYSRHSTRSSEDRDRRYSRHLPDRGSVGPSEW